MAKATPYASPARPRRTSKHYQTLAQPSGKVQDSATSSLADHQAVHAVAADTLSDWRRKSMAATPSYYRSEFTGNRC